MTTLLEFIARIAVFIYILAAVGIFFAIRGLVEARRKGHLASFMLEREAARRQQRSAVTTLLTLSALASIVYIIDTIVAPNLSNPLAELTPTPPLFTTQAPTASPARLLYPTITPTIGLPPSDIEVQPTAQEPAEGCTIAGATITVPEPGQNVSGQVRVEGEADALDFSHYKFELRGAGTNDQWVVVGTYMIAVSEGLLGVWDSTSLPPGPYTLRLSVFQESGGNITPCDVPVVIVRRDTGS
nr:hypothetical protein [Anaerolineae bacterium]